MRPIAISLLLVMTAADLPADPVQRVAEKALAGEYGDLERWQEKAYQYALAQGTAPAGLCWQTYYTPYEGYDRGEATAHGYGCSERTAAANAIPAHWYVMVELPGGWTVRQIQDTGASFNDPVARRKGAKLWIDLWSDKREHTNVSSITRYALIRAYKTW